MKKKWILGAAVVGFVGIMMGRGVLAYLTDHESTVNEFTVGKVDIELKEPDWDPDDAKKLEPGDVLNKNPQITNTGINDAFVYLEVSVPVATVTAADAAGNRQSELLQELFSYTAADTWKQIKAKNTNQYHIYTYVYNQILKKGETTTPLFDTVTFLNIIEGQLDGGKLDIPIRAYAIQTEHTGDGKSTILDQAIAAYNKYVNQNSGQDGGVKG